MARTLKPEPVKSGQLEGSVLASVYQKYAERDTRPVYSKAAGKLSPNRSRVRKRRARREALEQFGSVLTLDLRRRLSWLDFKFNY